MIPQHTSSGMNSEIVLTEVLHWRKKERECYAHELTLAKDFVGMCANIESGK